MAEEEKITEEQASDQMPEAEESPGEGPAEEPCEEQAAEAPEAEAQEEKKEEDEDLQTKFLRLSADFANYRRRTEKEKSDIYAFANEKIALQLLDVIDNFERAMQSAPADDKFAEGMQLILKQFGDVLERNNIAEIKALGEDFDPALHNAVMTEAAGEEFSAGKVTKVLQKGYTLNGKVIRAAMVSVAQ